MSFYSLLRRPAANIAKTANIPQATQYADPCEYCENCESEAGHPTDSQHSQDSQAVRVRTASGLDRLRGAAGDRWRLIKGEDHGPAELLDSMPDAAVEAYALACVWRVLIRQGIAPPEFTEVRACPRCGPVAAPAGLDCDKGCPWCQNRRTGRPVPRVSP